MKFLRHSWVLPFVVVLYIYGSEALGVFMGDPEHYELINGLGLSGISTSALVWFSVVIETAIIAAVFWKPTSLTFSFAALWPWVPRIIGALTGTDIEMTEMTLSLSASVAAMCAYMAYEEFNPRILVRRTIEQQAA